MKPIIFNCPVCGQELEAAADLLGEKIDCPNCKKELTVTRPKYSDAAILLLGVSIAAMVGCLFYSFMPGLVASGFLAVIGAILMLKK